MSTDSSSSTTDWIATAQTLLSAAAGPAGAVTATANLLAEGLKLIEPILSNDETQQYENAKKARIQEALDILSQPDSHDRQQRLAGFASQLLLDAGNPIPGGMGSVPLVGVRVEFLLAAFSAIAGKICDGAYLTSLTQNALKAQPAQPAAK